jgi:hypothetical protein
MNLSPASSINSVMTVELTKRNNQMKAILFLAAMLVSMSALSRGSTTHPVAYLEVKAPPGWTVSYCTISGPAGAYAWATPSNGETCYFGYLNYAGTYTVTVYEESPVRTQVTSEQLVVSPLVTGESVPVIIIQMEAE